jgi:uncharacterized protein YkwD
VRPRHALLTLLLAAIPCLLPPASAAAPAKATVCRGASEPITAETIDSAERSLLCLVNVYRAASGADVLTEDRRLARAARKHSEFMEAKGQLAHEGIGDGTPTSRAEDAGFACGGIECVGENVAQSTAPSVSPNDLFEAWRNSTTGHDQNMLDGAYVTAGMGLAVGPNLGVTGTQSFATVDNGATGTAADMLTSPACESARAALKKAKGKVRAARQTLAGAKGAGQVRRAKQKLKRAKRRAQAKSAAAERACNLTY